MMLRSLSMRAEYRYKMQGAVDRRRSIPRDVFLKIEIPIPPNETQKSLILKRRAIENARLTAKNLEVEIEKSIEELLHPEDL